jgi:hypothetical protein
MTVTADPARAERDDSDPDDHGPTDFEPIGVTPRYPPPRAGVDPDPDKGWIRRLLPIVLAYKRLLTLSLLTAAVALIAQISVPLVVRGAIDTAIIDQTAALEPYIVALVITRAECAPAGNPESRMIGSFSQVPPRLSAKH